MNNLLASFFIGLSCTILLFAISFFVVLGAKSLLIYFSMHFYKKQMPEKTRAPRKKHSRPSAVIKSIEIDPGQVDRIYVKKSS